ncbi:MAG: hypothetical protein IH946_05105 [Bacteroidetes bacterium]|nr:hypothetical protein [Bacteroidota bacterium]
MLLSDAIKDFLSLSMVQLSDSKIPELDINNKSVITNVNGERHWFLTDVRRMAKVVKFGYG